MPQHQDLRRPQHSVPDKADSFNGLFAPSAILGNVKLDAAVLLSKNVANERHTCHLMNCKAPMPVVMQASFIASTHLSGLDHEPPILRCLTSGSNICTPNTARFRSWSYKFEDDDNMTGRDSALKGH